METKKDSSIPPTQVICSTLNQMVNYITIKTFEPEKIINLTLKNSSDNNRWDKNLKKVLKENAIIDEAISVDIVCDHEKLKENIKKRIKDNGALLWNITGGQRYFTLAVFEIFKERQGDFLCYLEGNSNRILVLENKGGEGIKKYDNKIVNLPCITVKSALDLMGFEAKDKTYDYKITFKATHDGKAEDSKENDKNSDFENFLNAFEELETDDDFREICFKANREQIASEVLNKYDICEKVKTNLMSKNFGKPFEWMVGAEIKRVIEEKCLPVNEMILSQKINFSNNELKVDGHAIDEFDIILSTSNGKVVVFELKTGNMTGDVAKGTKYSTYAVGGVYGMPILIVPLKKDEINNPASPSFLDEETRNALHRTVNAARRATLEVWGIDKINEKLIEKLQSI